MGPTRGIWLCALLCAAGCQTTEGGLRAVDENNAYAASLWQAEGFVIKGDTRRVSLDFQPPPLRKDMDSDTYFMYLSLPLHPLNGIEFHNPSVGVGWSDMAMQFTNVFTPFPASEPNPYRRTLKRGEIVFEEPVDWQSPPTSSHELELGPVDVRHAAYAAALRDEMYYGAPWRLSGDVVARAEGAPKSSADGFDPSKQTD